MTVPNPSPPISGQNSNLQTPSLSPTSTQPSPAFSTLLKSPALSTLSLDPRIEGEDPDHANLEVSKPLDGDDQKLMGQGWKMPECWGHRGASATFPENTRASFIEACKAGADGIETDIHMTKDNVLVMFHDPELSRTTDGKGRIDTHPWNGVLEHVRTLEAPHQPIPQFTEVLDILMMPENSHVKLNLDCKVENDPTRLFGLIKAVVENYEGWATKLAPRIILGIWHPKFILPALEILPYLPRYAITMSLTQARTYFFKSVHGFSVYYELLATADGKNFLKEAREAGKWICAWTVNEPEKMKQCARWGIRSVISDKPALWREIRKEILENREKALAPTLQSFISPFLGKKNYWFDVERKGQEETEYLEREGGKFDSVVIPDISLKIARPADVLARSPIV